MSFINRSSDQSTQKILLGEDSLKLKVFACQALGAKVVLTIGSWDLLHIGHVRYLMKAQTYGDILVVGVDSDRAVKKYKGVYRPIIPERERQEMVSYLSCVDFVTSVDDVDDEGKWQYGLLRLIRPDVFVAVEDSYPPEQCAQIERFSGELIVLPRQADNTSSTGIIQKLIKGDPEMMKQLAEGRE